jgi:diguanylate cyclase (GGDEF)-like protein
MLDNQPIRVAIVLTDAQLRDRATAALQTRDFQVSVALDDALSSEGCQVLILDQPPSEAFVRHLVEQGGCAVVGTGFSQSVDAELPPDFTDRELRLTVQLMAQVAALRAERDALIEAHSAVRELADTDPLTGLPNRRAWQQQVPALLARANRNGEPAWLALLDLDGFKQINDQQGMLRGDQVLTRCAESLSAALRRDDLIARLGGDEFGILLVAVSEDRVWDVFERLRAAVAADAQVTASIGLAAANSGINESELLGAAESAMRAAKRAGGNCLVRSN